MSWTTKPLSAKVIKRFPRIMREQMAALIINGQAEWRITGHNHLQIRPLGDGIPVSLSLTAENDPTYAAKWRSFYRHWFE